MSRVLELSGITKRFGDTLANDDVSLHLDRGEIVALLGENGAGKTTLMSILFGHYTADAGSVRVEGATLPPGRSRAAIQAGVGMVHQHFALAANLTVLDNIMTGTEPLWRLRSDRAGARTKLLALSEKFGLPVDPDATIADLSVGERQRVEILKALFNDARILILDEPTAVLTAPEAERLFATLRDMAARGLSLIFISHKLHEVMSASDRVVVLRGGRVVAERATAQTSKHELAELMVGRAVQRPESPPAAPGAIRLEARDVHLTPASGTALKGIDFTLRAGETLGIIGVSGNGQGALAGLVSGLHAPERGSFLVQGKPLATHDVPHAIAAGIGRVPEDRQAEGTLGDMSTWENVVLERLWSPEFSRRGILRRGAARAATRKIIADYDVRGATVDGRVRLLSGGNMQKLILGRVLETQPDILVAAQPSRGLDEGAIAGVHRRLIEARDRGAAVLLISEDLDEVITLADRICAIVGGRLSPPIPSEKVDARTLGLMMSGDWSVTEEVAHAV
ncbi:Galactose/methyl galactoside import ATP-binding protein MglA [Roseivivax sp. THAF40]|uniref:ABC transporter ATP-binding protein n=1 Tax=unclassified Roseivivax TaxID=2639302 RepID=UPI00126981C5|nr:MULTISPECIES: ABC transporter ATP-binding protein [unclassified Roseivivax]QFS83254.1 Galactose/methyl galactoside import ATP-binding protein MglA [Roseivivax sp. THAF197b]QFT46998.1 Galactose/methyl galactoside import ATP-binding protein MglA [Roseivivax sp. THAF40]